MRIFKSDVEDCIAFLESTHEIKRDPRPLYPGEVWAAVGFLSGDPDYLLHHEELREAAVPIEEMTMEQLATMFTYYKRGERVTEGLIASGVENGTLLRLLRRLEALI